MLKSDPIEHKPARRSTKLILQHRVLIIAIVISAGFAEPVFCQPLVSNYFVDIDNRFRLVHSSRDAFLLIDREAREELLMIDPVWDHLKLDAFCRVPNAILLRAISVNESGLPTDEPPSFYILDTLQPSKVSSNSLELSPTRKPNPGPFTERVYQSKLKAMSISTQNILWTDIGSPTHFRIGVISLMTILHVVLWAGYILPLPFVFVLLHYIIAKYRLEQKLKNSRGIEGQTTN